jgi:hypothetical protein
MSAAQSGEHSRLAHFLALGREAQAGAVRRMATAGHSVATITAATRLSEEQIREILDGHS